VVVEVRETTDGFAIDVTDQGIGIPEPLLSRVFEPLVTGRDHGTGMGLAIAARIARSHGGSLEVVETGPRGTRMRLVLPG